MNGIKVNLYRLDNDGSGYTLWDTEFTGHKPGTPSDDGYYKFCAPPGTYYLEIGTILNGLVAAQEDVGNNEEIDSDITNDNGPNTTDSFTVISGDEKCDLGAGFYLMGTAGDRVWRDDNGNGQQENFEPRMANVTIQAIDITGDVIAEAQTDSEGNYEIDYLQKEDYFFKVILPSGMSPTVANNGNDDNDSDVDNSNGLNTTRLYTMVPGEHIPSIDVGLVFGTVPVEFTEFNGENRKTHNYIYWSTATEVNNERFDLERSIDNSDFTKIAEIEGAGTVLDVRNYDFEDEDISVSGIYYYRLKQLDYDGNHRYSGTIAIKVQRNDRSGMIVYPNPAVEDVNLSLRGLGGIAADANIEIYDITGKMVTDWEIVSSQSAESLDMILDVSKLAEGIYSIRLTNGEETYESKLIKVTE